MYLGPQTDLFISFEFLIFREFSKHKILLSPHIRNHTFQTQKLREGFSFLQSIPFLNLMKPTELDF